MKFPLTKTYIWKSNDINVLKKIISQLSSASSFYRPLEDWEIGISLKQTKAKQKLLDGGFSDLKDTDNDLAIYFIKYYDSDCLVYIPKNELNLTNCNINELNQEDKISRKNDLKVRTSWKVIGQQFYTDTYVISVGAIEHGDYLTPVLEISTVKYDEKGMIEDIRLSIVESMDRLAEKLISNDELVSLKGFLYEDPSDTTKDDFQFSIFHRTLQWIQAVNSIK